MKARGGQKLETYKLYENKPPEMIMERTGTQDAEKSDRSLTSVPSSVKPMLPPYWEQLGTLDRIIQATDEDLALCPGSDPRRPKAAQVLKESFKRKNNDSWVNSPIYCHFNESKTLIFNQILLYTLLILKKNPSKLLKNALADIKRVAGEWKSSIFRNSEIV